jgi:putative tryptophan/tyrosine transport system substrate-binding protein
VTGLSTLAPPANGRRLQLLRELMPGVSRVMFLAPTAGAEATGALQEVRQTAQLLGVQILIPHIVAVADLPEALQMALDERAEAIWMSGSPLLGGEVGRIMEFATAAQMPVLSQTRIFADAGGLIYYGSNRLAQFRRAATYVDRILKGANPAEMPVEQPTEFELVINLRTAEALGITIPPTVLGQARTHLVAALIPITAIIGMGHIGVTLRQLCRTLAAAGDIAARHPPDSTTSG